MDKTRLKLARDFFSLYRIEPIDSQTYILTSSQDKLLVKTHLIDPADS